MVDIPIVSDLIDEIEETILDPIQSIGDTVESITDTLSGVYDTVTSLPETIMGGVERTFERIKEFFGSFVTSMERAFEDIAHSIVEPLSNAIDGIQSFITTAFNSVTNAFTEVGQAIERAFGYLRDQMARVVDVVSNTLGDIRDFFQTTVADFFTDIAAKVETGFEAIWETLQDMGKWLQEMDQAFTNTLNDLYENMPYYIGQGTGWVVEKMIEVVLPRLLEIMTEIINGFAKGFGEVEIDFTKLKKELQDTMQVMQDVQREMTQAVS